jgi:hypothetical protein
LKLSFNTSRNFVVTFFFFIAFIFSSNIAKSVLCLSTGNGLWTNPATWSCGHVPTCGDSMVIQSIHTVTLDTQQDYTGCAQGPIVVVYGTMQCENGNKLKLPCTSRIYIMPGGSVKAGSGSGNSNYIEICNDVVWNAGMGDLTGPACMPSSSTWCNGVVLPVELVSFTGDAKDGYIDLNWATATEENCHHFDVERSVDAQVFQKFTSINTKALNGNSQAILKYNAVDGDPISNVSYYRLKQVDISNAAKYGPVISVNYIKSKNIKFVVYPNPNKGEFTADITGIENNHEVTISLRDERGNSVYESEFYIMDAGSNKLQIIPQNRLNPGMYICTLTLEGIQYNVKVVVS